MQSSPSLVLRKLLGIPSPTNKKSPKTLRAEANVIFKKNQADAHKDKTLKNMREVKIPTPKYGGRSRKSKSRKRGRTHKRK